MFRAQSRPLAAALPLAALFLAAASFTVGAQPAPSLPYEPPTRCSSLSVFGGVATADADTGALIGGAGGWQANRWFGLEGNAAWFDRSGSETGFSAALAVHVSLMGRQLAVPFLKTGLGLYHASVALDDEDAPMFYRGRFHSDDTRMMARQSFTDPAFIAGGGVDIFLTRQMAIRPEAEVMFVVHEGDSRPMGVFAVHLAYHFEDHPVTPWRR
jgi:hypothetical protein